MKNSTTFTKLLCEVVVFSFVLGFALSFSPQKVAAASIIQNPIGDFVENQHTSGLYPAERIIPATSFTATSLVINVDPALSYAVPANMSLMNSNGTTIVSWSPSAFQLSDGYRYQGAAFPLTAGQTYYILYGDNNHDFYFRGTSNVSYSFGSAGGVTLGGSFTPNVSRGLSMLNWQFALCDSSFCQMGIGLSFGSATSSSFWGQYNATDTLAALNNSCSQISNIFGSALCIAGSYLFVPDPSVLQGYADLGTVIESKKPFSYFYQVKDLYGSLASSTNSLPVYTYDLHSVDPATSTPMGAILPSFSILSSSTVTYFMPAGSLDTLLALAAIALYLTLAADIFFTIRNLIRT